MPNLAEKDLNQEDKEILEIIEDAGKQYEKYLEINESLSALNFCFEPETKYDWEHPLTLVVHGK